MGTHMHAMRPKRLLFTLLLLAPWAKALKSSNVTEEMMAKMVSLVEEVQQQLEQLEQKNTDLSIDMKRREKEMGEQVKRLEKENAEQSTKLASEAPGQPGATIPSPSTTSLPTSTTP